MKPPPGWVETPRFFNFPQKFMNRADKSQYIFVTYPSDPRPASPPSSESWTPIVICGSHPAMLVQGRADLGNGAVHIDAVDTTWGTSRMTAMYARPLAAPPNPAAESAIRSLCK